MEYGIDDKYMKELRDILASVPEIEEAVLYGSRARGDYKRGSDIDLTLKGEKLGREQLVLLRDKLYLSRLPYFVDTNIFSQLKSQPFINNILRDGIVIYRRSNGKTKSAL
ncbi:MAG: nucleotidyltransferase domain-containing protein [Prevotella sp.]